ncbi:MAG: hypothetical protein KAS67_03930, partial [Thermoplasmata archaeon]|nr:hypothetical protein [Thermoplasmata archaeon]
MSKRKIAMVVIALLLMSSLGIMHLADGPGDTETPYVEKSGTRSEDFASYHNYEAMADYLQGLADDHPEIVKLEDLGDTKQGRDILAVKVSDNVETDEPGEPDILYMGGHHGNEPISVEVPLYLLDFLVTNYDTNGKVARWVDSREIWFVPMVNPDGIEAGTRKNQNIIDLDGDGTMDSGTGVDLNRNYDQNWGTQGTSTDPTDTTYCGEYAFSEYETRAIWDLADAHNFVLSMSFHSFGEKVYYPWGNTIETASPQSQLLEDISAEIAERNGYLAIEGNEDGTYVTSGDSDDWLYSRGTLPFTIELSTQFRPPEAVIEAICRQNLDSSLYILEIADQPSLATLPDWTFMVFMAGDNSLNLAAIEDVNEMEITGSTQDVNVIALYDGISTGDSKLYKITKDGMGQNSAIVSQVLDEQGQIIDPATNEADMSSPLVLENFIDWTMAKYPAQKTALVIWDHGDGLMGGLAKDGNYWMPTWGMRTALIGHHIDMIGTDLCWQGNFETAYEVIGYSDYYVGSAAEEPQDGWDYAAITEYLGQYPNSAPGELSRELVRIYKASAAAIPYATLSAIDLYVMEKELMPVFEEFSLCMYDFMYHNQTAIKGARTVASVFDIDRPHFVDLHEFAENLMARDIPSPL